MREILIGGVGRQSFDVDASIPSVPELLEVARRRS